MVATYTFKYCASRCIFRSRYPSIAKRNVTAMSNIPVDSVRPLFYLHNVSIYINNVLNTHSTSRSQMSNTQKKTLPHTIVQSYQKSLEPWGQNKEKATSQIKILPRKIKYINGVENSHAEIYAEVRRL